MLDPDYPDDDFERYGRAYILPLPLQGSLSPSEVADAVLDGDDDRNLNDIAIPGDLTRDGYDDVIVILDNTALLLDGPVEGNLLPADLLARAHTRFAYRSVHEAHAA